MRSRGRRCGIPWALVFLLALVARVEGGYAEPQKSTSSSSYVTIDNGVIGEPEVRCGSDDISLHFSTQRSFMGKIFVKGHVGESECMQMGDGRTGQSFTIRFDSCGVRRQREINGVVIIATVIVSFHSIFITKVDRAYRTSCFYMEATKTVNTQVDVGQLTTAMIHSQVPIPTCRYEILGGGPSGTAVSFARIGDSVYHKWTCDATVSDVYCMRVHTCTVYDGQGGNPVTVIDVNGCSVDSAILRPLDYTSDMQAGQESPVFKFADRVGLYFNCQIQLTLKEKQYGCLAAQPECPAPYQAQVEPSTRTSEDVEDRPSIEKEHMSGYPTRQHPYTGTSSTRPHSSREQEDSTGIFATTPSGYRYLSTASSVAGSSREGSGDYSTESAEENTDRTQAPMAIKVNPFAHVESQHSKEAMPPGLKPQYGQDDSTESNEHGQKAAGGGGQRSGIKYQAALEVHHPSGSPSSGARAGSTVAPEPEPYTRLIRRRARARSAGRTVESDSPSNATNPLFVADFDLPERGLIVLGLEDGHDSESLAQADKLFNQASPSEECANRALPVGYAFLFGSLFFTISFVLALLAYIIFKQRQIIKTPLF